MTFYRSLWNCSSFQVCDWMCARGNGRPQLDLINWRFFGILRCTDIAPRSRFYHILRSKNVWSRIGTIVHQRFQNLFYRFSILKKTTQQEIDRKVEEPKLGFSETATKIWWNFHLSFNVTNRYQILWLSQNIWTLPKYNTYTWGNKPIVNHGSGNFSLL